jgi:hypothetical protein
MFSATLNAGRALGPGSDCRPIDVGIGGRRRRNYSSLCNQSILFVPDMCRIPSMNQFRPVWFVICVTLPLAGASHQWANAEPAHFWISTSSVSSPVPESPSIKRPNGSVGYLHIWAQPMTRFGGNYHAVSNPFKELRNLSLNLVTDTTVIDFLDNGIEVYNPTLDATTRRFQFVFDSDSDPALKSKFNGGGTPDRIDGLQAFSIGDDDLTFTGIGPNCAPGDPFCVNPGGGGPPAWLIASVAYQTIQNSGTIKVDLQIGSNGMNHVNATSGLLETTSLTSVMFGIGSATYNASTNRGTNSLDSSAELTITACAAIAGDYNGNCAVDAADFTIWRDTLGSMTDLRANGNNIGPSMNKIDAADYTVWKNNFGMTAGAGAGGGSLSAEVVPEPATLALLLALGGCWMLTSRRRP